MAVLSVLKSINCLSFERDSLQQRSSWKFQNVQPVKCLRGTVTVLEILINNCLTHLMWLSLSNLENQTTWLSLRSLENQTMWLSPKQSPWARNQQWRVVAKMYRWIRNCISSDWQLQKKHHMVLHQCSSLSCAVIHHHCLTLRCFDSHRSQC
jgi:hypothetical protein